jgi:hypothetical protein
MIVPFGRFVCHSINLTGFVFSIPAPAVQQLTRFTESELVTLHGFGHGSLPKLRLALEK